MIQINVICNKCRIVGGTSYAYNRGVHVMRREMHGKGWLRLPSGEDYCPSCRPAVVRKLSAPQKEILSECLRIVESVGADHLVAQIRAINAEVKP